MKITVTKDDIAAGHRRDSKNCPVALALRRAGVNHCGVAGILVVVEQDDKRVSLVLPERAQEWIRDYDWGFAMGPFEFELTLPEPRGVIAPAPQELLPKVTVPAGLELASSPVGSQAAREEGQPELELEPAEAR
jgi:hypothetical protein